MAAPVAYSDLMMHVEQGKIGIVCACSLDGFHSQDLAMYLQVMPNSVMAQLAASGVTYPNAYLPGPSDSFPGILAITTGNNVTATGVFYGEPVCSLIALWHFTRLCCFILVLNLYNVSQHGDWKLLPACACEGGSAIGRLTAACSTPDHDFKRTGISVVRVKQAVASQDVSLLDSTFGQLRNLQHCGSRLMLAHNFTGPLVHAFELLQGRGPPMACLATVVNFQIDATTSQTDLYPCTDVNRLIPEVASVLAIWSWLLLADDSYARDLYQSGSCTTLGQGTPSGMPGTECAYTEAQDFNIYSLGGIDGVDAFNGPATNVNILGTDYPYAGLNGTAVNVRTFHLIPSSLPAAVQLYAQICDDNQCNSCANAGCGDVGNL